jgi:hypothetical protein
VQAHLKKARLALLLLLLLLLHCQRQHLPLQRCGLLPALPQALAAPSALALLLLLQSVGATP